jgi:hypothetical protein
MNALAMRFLTFVNALKITVVAMANAAIRPTTSPQGA